ncbi:hypothetical protein PsYK624_149440 [Phanerochaete sordida]|uniref:Uncharacterized protein n=1 Tax=Phanerochaete sordida TaxID=48140 RepID=A0A9P3LLH7_9APHY|nr:hypothetical protein PsYK624_149440 [Phanerochaete sordida]
MKLPSLGRFFHKRSRSDSALYQRTQPEVQLPPRPVSVSFSNGAVLSLDTHVSSFSDILSGVPTVPLAVSLPRPVSCSTTSSSGSHISAASEPVVIDALARRIQELEDTIKTQEETRSSTSSPTNGSLESVHETATEAEKRNTELADEVTNLRSELELARAELDTLRGDHTRFKALLSVPVLSAVLAQLDAGADAEDALVAALQHAVRAPDSAWRALLEPVTGARAPEDYIAQVHCTLRARREGRAWQKRAAFWRHSAREHDADTVTPSASQLSDVVAAQEARGAAAPVALVDSGTRVSLVQVQVEVVREVEVEKGEERLEEPVQDCIENMPSPPFPVHEAEAPTPPQDNERPVPAPADDVFSDARKPSLPMSDTVQTVKAERAAPELYAHLPPLASVTFRASHSIRSLSPKKEGVLVASASVLSQASRRSSASSAAPSTPTRAPAKDAQMPTGYSFGSLATNLSVRAFSPPAPKPEALLSPAAEANASRESRETAGSDFSSTSWDVISTFINRSLSFTSLAKTLSPSPKPAPPPAPQPSEPAPPPTSPPTSPPKLHTRTPPRAQGTASPAASPPKKSRLPLPALPRVAAMKHAMGAQGAARALRRLSRQVISRPVLVDSTNAAAVGDARPGAQTGGHGAQARAREGTDARAEGAVQSARGAKSEERGGKGVPRKMSDAPRPGGARGVAKENPVAGPPRGRRPTVVGHGGSPPRKPVGRA